MQFAGHLITMGIYFNSGTNKVMFESHVYAKNICVNNYDSCLTELFCLHLHVTVQN